tara:strand:+ start:15676 stop:16164 length:489 start_codon:yes stop_codon:yes gene_type:complete
MNLSELDSSAGSIGVELDDPTLMWKSTTATSKSPEYPTVKVSSLNLTANLAEAINIKIPDGKKAILLSASIAMNATSGIKVQLELDGVLRVNETNAGQQPGYGISLLGVGVTSGLVFTTGSDGLGRPNNIANVVFRDRLIIRASEPNTTNATVAVTYILVKG